MSDARSEVKRWRQWKKFDDGSIEIYPWNNSTGPDVPCFIAVEDHDRILAERDELWKRATKFVMPGEMDTGESIEHYIKTLERTIAELKAKVERLIELTEPVAVITDSPFMVENITIDQRYKFEQTVARQARVIEKLKTALEECECQVDTETIKTEAENGDVEHWVNADVIREIVQTALADKELPAIEQQEEGT